MLLILKLPTDSAIAIAVGCENARVTHHQFFNMRWVTNPPYSATVKRQADVRGYNGQRVKKEINLINSHYEGTAK